MNPSTPTPAKTPLHNVLIGYQAEDGSWQKYATFGVSHDPEYGAHYDIPVGPFPLGKDYDAVKRGVEYVLNEFACVGTELKTKARAYRIDAW